jgi:hypothetical protein
MTTMTFAEAVALLKTHSFNGLDLRDGLLAVKEKMRVHDDELSDSDRIAFRIVSREKPHW